MLKKTIIQAAGELVKRDFDLSKDAEFLSEAELVEALANQVAYMLEYQIESLFSSLYRMDVSEQKVQEALQPNAPDPANIGIAKLIVERQKKRVETKLTYQQDGSGDWFDF